MHKRPGASLVCHGTGSLSAGMVCRRTPEIPDTIPLDSISDADRSRIRSLYSPGSDHYLFNLVWAFELRLHAHQRLEFPPQVAIGRHSTWVQPPLPSDAGTHVADSLRCSLLRGLSRLWQATAGNDGVLHRRFALVRFLSLSL